MRSYLGMTVIRWTFVCYFAFLLLCIGCNQSTDGQATGNTSPQALELLKAVEDTFSDKDCFTVDMDITAEMSGMGSESGPTNLVSKRPYSFRHTNYFDGGLMSIDLCNGEKYWSSKRAKPSDVNKTFRKGAFQHVNDLSVCGGSVNGEVVLSLYAPDWVDRITEHAVSIEYLGEKKLKDSRKAHHVRIERELWNEEMGQRQRDWRDLWISLGDKPVILRNELQYQSDTPVMDETFSVRYQENEVYKNWDFAPEISDDTFVVPGQEEDTTE